MAVKVGAGISHWEDASHPSSCCTPRSSPLCATCSCQGQNQSGGAFCALLYELHFDAECCRVLLWSLLLLSVVRCWMSHLHHLPGGLESFQDLLLLADSRSPAPGPCPEPGGRGPAFASGFSGARRLGGVFLEENSCCYPQRTLSCGSPRIRPKEGIIPTLPVTCSKTPRLSSSAEGRKVTKPRLSAKERSSLALPGHSMEG